MWSLTSSEASTTIFGAKGIGEAKSVIFNYSSRKAANCIFSVYYTHLPQATGVAERIRDFNPNARLIYMVRDPTERTISHYWHRVIYNSEDRSLSRAIAEDTQYCDVSYYAMQLNSYFKQFNRDQIKILTLEELIQDHDKTSQIHF